MRGRSAVTRAMSKAGVVLLILLVAFAGAPLAAGQEVVLNPGYISGAIQMGGEIINYAGVAASFSTYSASTNFYPNSPLAPYSLTVNVPEGTTPSYSVWAGIYLDNYRDFVQLSPRYVPVEAFATSTMNFGMADPGRIQGVITVNGGVATGSNIYMQRSAPAENTYSRTYMDAGGAYSVAVVPNTQIQVYGSVSFPGNLYVSLPSQFVDVAAGQTVTVNWTVDAPLPPQTGAIAGDVSIAGPLTPYATNIYASGPSYRYASVSGGAGPYTMTDVTAGNYYMYGYSYWDNGSTTLRYPYSAFTPTYYPIVSAGQTTEVDVSINEAFIQGNLSITGTSTLLEANYANISATGNYPSSAYGASASTRPNLQTGAYRLVVTDGQWRTGYVNSRWYNTSPDRYINSNLSITDYRLYNSPLTLAAGQPITVDQSYKTGTFTVTFRVAGGGLISAPQVNGYVTKSNESGQPLWGYSYSSYGNQQNVEEAQVTFVGLEGAGTLTAGARVGSSWVTFGTININVVAGADQKVDIGGPALTIQYPEPDYISENQTIVVTGTATDDIAVAGVTVNGVEATLTPAAGGPEVSFTANVTLPGKGPHQLVTVATDASGKTATDTRRVYWDEYPPHLTWIPADGAVTSASEIMVQGLATNDAGVASVTVDGIPVTLTSTNNPNDPLEVSFSKSVALQPGDNYITVVATDVSTRTITQTHRITRSDNAPPLAQDDEVIAYEGPDVKVHALMNDSDPDGDPLSIVSAGAAGNGMTTVNADGAVTYSPSAGFNGSDSFDYTISDGKGGLATATVHITILNAPPQLGDLHLSPDNINEAGAVALTGTFVDPGALDSFSVEVDWGDGTVETLPLPAGSSLFTLDHQYLDDDPSGTSADAYSINVTLTDSDGGSAAAGAAVTVNNLAPVITSALGPVAPLLVGSTAGISATFDDPGIRDSHTVTLDWGDGSSSAGAVSERSLTASHTYTQAGVYYVSLSLADDDGGLAGAAVPQPVVVYDPAAGTVTGGGWAYTTAGALTADPALTGRATFGFVSRYQKEAATPSGQTEFQLRVGNLNFHSTSYDWLVVSGAKARYQGQGNINGEGSYGFMLSALDGASDQIRLKIWDLATGGIVFDSQPGAADTADPATVLGGGSIVIHS